MQRKIKLTRWFVYEWGKPPRQKPHWMILRSPLLRIHYYHNKRLQVKEFQSFIPTYSWTLAPIPNWTCFVVTIFPFNAQLTVHDWPIETQIPVHNLITNLRRMLATKFFSSSTRWISRTFLVTKPYGVQTQQLFEEKDELGQIISGHNMLIKNPCINCDGP